jgi:P27 family predicted phage terminase small subunit
VSTQGRKAHLKVIEGGLDEVPPAPISLPVDMHDEWHAIVSDLRDRQLLHASMIGSIEMYLLALLAIRQCQRAIDEHGMIVNGAEGAMKPNPASSMMWRSQAVATRLAAELGLTPAARSRAALAKPEKDEDDGQFSLLDL